MKLTLYTSQLLLWRYLIQIRLKHQVFLFLRRIEQSLYSFLGESENQHPHPYDHQHHREGFFEDGDV